MDPGFQLSLMLRCGNERDAGGDGEENGKRFVLCSQTEKKDDAILSSPTNVSTVTRCSPVEEV